MLLDLDVKAVHNCGVKKKIAAGWETNENLKHIKVKEEKITEKKRRKNISEKEEKYKWKNKWKRRKI